MSQIEHKKMQREDLHRKVLLNLEGFLDREGVHAGVSDGGGVALVPEIAEDEDGDPYLRWHIYVEIMGDLFGRFGRSFLTSYAARRAIFDLSWQPKITTWDRDKDDPRKEGIAIWEKLENAKSERAAA